MPDSVSCPWCCWELDLTIHPMSEEAAERRREHHKVRCPKRHSESHRGDNVDVHGDVPFEEGANQ